MPPRLEPADLLELAAALGRMGARVEDASLVDRIRALEVLKAAAAAAQACAAAALDVSQRAEQAAAGVPVEQRGQGVGAQVALARRESPHRGARHLGLAKALVHEMPHTLAALRDGRISEWRATLLVRETAVLTREDRAAVDAEVAGDPDQLQALERLGDRALVARAKQVAYRLDPHSVVERARRAERDRCVTVRPAPDTMAYLTALLPARDAIAVHTALGRVADSTRSAGGGGDEARGRGQLMADTLVARVLDGAGAQVGSVQVGSVQVGSVQVGGAQVGGAQVGGAMGVSGGAGAVRDGGAAHGAGTAPRSLPRDVAVRLVMTDRALLDGDPEPAHLDGYGTVPAAWARDVVASTLVAGTGSSSDPTARVFITRLFTDRHGGLVAMDSRARTAPPGLADLIRTRDRGTCRTPYCDAPARHVDHVTPHARGGSTDARDLQGLCEACNYAKQAHGWRQQAPPLDRAGGRHVVITTTPTGHTYVSCAPPLPGSPRLDLPAPPGARPLAASDTSVGSTPVIDLCTPSPVEGHLAGRLVLAA